MNAGGPSPDKPLAQVVRGGGLPPEGEYRTPRWKVTAVYAWPAVVPAAFLMRVWFLGSQDWSREYSLPALGVAGVIGFGFVAMLVTVLRRVRWNRDGVEFVWCSGQRRFYAWEELVAVRFGRGKWYVRGDYDRTYVLTRGGEEVEIDRDGHNYETLRAALEWHLEVQAEER